MITTINEFKTYKLNEVSFNQIEHQFVNTNKISKNVFNDIKNNIVKSAYATWIIKQILNNNILSEDIYKYKNYFDIFDRNKKQYKYQDINKYNTKEDINDFLSKTLEIIKLNNKDKSTIKGISKQDKFKDYLLYETPQYNIYKFSENIHNDEKDLHNAYFAACKLGSGTQLCTSNSKDEDSFIDYTTESDLYYIISKDKKEKYAYSYEHYEFKDKRNSQIFLSYDEITQDLLDTFIIIEKIDNKPIPEEILEMEIGPLMKKNRKRIDIDDEYY